MRGMNVTVFLYVHKSMYFSYSLEAPLKGPPNECLKHNDFVLFLFCFFFCFL